MQEEQGEIAEVKMSNDEDGYYRPEVWRLRLGQKAMKR